MKTTKTKIELSFTIPYKMAHVTCMLNYEEPTNNGELFLSSRVKRL